MNNCLKTILWFWLIWGMGMAFVWLLLGYLSLSEQNQNQQFVNTIEFEHPTCSPTAEWKTLTPIHCPIRD
ncbi:MAG: hypothetical protein AAGF83_09570 [Cyanobacteria bacterium P01_G01_bin.67]